MTKSPILVAAALACALGGAAAGSALGSTPVTDRSIVGDYYQTHASADTDVAPQGYLPNHYPLVTRQGTVPVAELATRGLYSQARYRAYAETADHRAMELANVADGPAPFSAETNTHTPERGDSSDRSDQPETRHAPAAPLHLAQGPATLRGEGGAKLIDVAASLALR